MENKKVSIIIPVLNEENIESFVSDLIEKSGKDNVEIIVVDGDASGSTVSKLDNFPVKTLICKEGRGSQLKKGAESSNGEILLFLHADTLLPENFYEIVTRFCGNVSPCGAFKLKIDSGRLIFRTIELFANLRAKYLRLPFGDQAFFIRKDIYEIIGGFSDVPIFEDVDIAGKIKRHGYHICISNHKILTSARRWEKEGIVKSTLRNWYLQILYFVFKLDPHYLKKFYRSRK